MNNNKNKGVTVFFIIIFELIFATICLAIFALPWSLKSYPMNLPFTVFSVLTTETSGADSSTFISALKSFIIPGTVLWIFVNLILFLIFKFKSLRLKKILKISMIFKSCVIVLQLFITIVVLKAWNYPKILYEKFSEPIDSDFYRENFISKHDVVITPPQKKQNLIVIFMESMESSYADIKNGGVFEENLIPNLTRLARQNVNFSESELLGGGENLQCNSWTVAGLLGKLMAVPYYFPFVKNRKEKTVECLPSALSLADILKNDGYNCVFSMGSEKQFENRDYLLEQHGYEIHDIAWYKENNYLDKNYKVFWGFEDAKLYDFAKMELENLSQKEEPFLYSFITVDTHFPYGFVCSECKDELPHQIQNVIRCADNLVNNFIEWCKTQSWYENTTILITGDHNYLSAPMNNFIKELSPLKFDEVVLKRKVLDVVINPAVEISKSDQKFRRFSSFDLMPTILEAIGYKFDKGGLQFGRSLLSEEKTLVEKYDVSEIEENILKPTLQYNALKMK